MRSYTGAEKRKRAWLVVRGVKQAAADAVQPGIGRQIDRIDARAEERGARETVAMRSELEKAKDAVAAAKVAARTADRHGKQAAREAVKTAEQALKRTQQAARPYGL
ncbi:hypothetical protein ACFVUB_11115 [Streptomyces niveus]|uniref:hypothetical protein n=1 Tax=Streptomyces niveus TaxID=193462 RepID=UPI0036DC053A